LALDDAFALGLALKYTLSSPSTGSSSSIKKALEIYDQTRRPHTSRLLAIVHGLVNKKADAFRSDAEEDAALIARMKNRPDTAWLSEHDVVAAFQRVVESFESRGHKL
jgi:salicylate hydroxylase